MKNRTKVWIMFSAFSGLALSIAPSECRANILFQVDLDTTPLLGHPATPFAINFQLNDGSGTNDGNNTASVYGFAFGGGSPLGSPVLTGGASGNLATAVTLTDSAFFNDFLQEFSAGTSLSFIVDMTSNADSGLIPDLFSFAILDGNGAEIPTLSPTGGFLNIDLTGPGAVIQAYRSDATIPVGAGPPVDISAPRVTTRTSSIPEPSTVGLVAIGLALWSVHHLLFRGSIVADWRHSGYSPRNNVG